MPPRKKSKSQLPTSQATNAALFNGFNLRSPAGCISHQPAWAIRPQAAPRRYIGATTATAAAAAAATYTAALAAAASQPPPPPPGQTEIDYEELLTEQLLHCVEDEEAPDG